MMSGDLQLPSSVSRKMCVNVKKWIRLLSLRKQKTPSAFPQIIFMMLLPIVSLNVENQLFYSAYKNVCGDRLCSTDLPNMTVAGGSSGKCAMRCSRLQNCRGFNWKTFGGCQLYFYESSAKNLNSVKGCRHFIGMYCCFVRKNVWFLISVMAIGFL